MLGFPKLTMGNSASQANDTDGCDSSNSSDIETTILDSFRSKPKSEETNTANMKNHPESAAGSYVDAAITTPSFPIQLLNKADFRKLQSLDQYEMISILFLLIDDYEESLKVMNNTSNNPGQFMVFLSDYLKSIDTTKKLIEALCVIQNYQILEELGYDKSKLKTHFLPHNFHVSVYINIIRKCCYRVMEDLRPKHEKELVDLIKKDLQTTYNKPMCCYTFMEMNLTYLFQIKYITNTSLDNLIKHFKVLEMDTYVEKFKNLKLGPVFQDKLRGGGQLNTDKSTAGNEYAIASTLMDARHRKLSFTNQPNVYPIDINNPGIVLIIENIHFWEDQSPEYADLLIKSDVALEERLGSTRDSERLRDIFSRFGYEIVYKKDQRHTQMLETIEDVTHNQIKEYHSSFIMIMLSHGRENQIIGCNSIPVNVNDIKQKINSKVLEDKPKILIFQACQGSSFLKIQSDDLCTDGPVPLKKSQIPWQKHILDYWSAVPGYVSFRHKRNGSWMIQTLCDVLESQMIDSFIDICTEVNRILGKRRVEFLENEENVMITPANTTLDKKFILPPLKPPHRLTN